MSDGECGEMQLGGNRPCTFGLNHEGKHSWESRPEGFQIGGGLTQADVDARLRTHPDSPAALALAALGPRRLIKKVLTFEVYRVDRSKKPWTCGPVLTTVKGWDAFDAFLAQHGTKLIRENLNGISLIRMPEGWDSMVVEMENHYSDGTVEVM